MGLPLPFPYMRIARLLLSLLLAPLALAAQGSTLLTPARVFDGAAVHEGWVVLVQGDSIVAAGPAESVHATGKRSAHRSAWDDAPSRADRGALPRLPASLQRDAVGRSGAPRAARPSRRARNESRAQHAPRRLHHHTRSRHRRRRLFRRRPQTGHRRKASFRARACWSSRARSSPPEPTAPRDSIHAGTFRKARRKRMASTH